jgi:hypothetical protein
MQQKMVKIEYQTISLQWCEEEVPDRRVEFEMQRIAMRQDVRTGTVRIKNNTSKGSKENVRKI